MILVYIILIALILAWFSAMLWLKKHVKAVSAAVSTCPKCGGKTTVSADPPNSRLVVVCQSDKCGHTSSRPVRASALSLFGVTQILLTLLAGALGYALGKLLGYHLFITVAGILIGGIVARFLVRLAALALLQSKLPPAWQEEVVAYLAPPPFLKKHGEILPAKEMKEKYNLTAERYQAPHLDPEKVPEQLRDLLLLATKWGIGDDIIRNDFEQKASEDEKQELKNSLSGRTAEVTQWLDSFEVGKLMPEEAACFMYMLEALDEMRLWPDN